MLSRASSKNHVPRRDRDLVRAHRAGDRVRASGGTATDAALETVHVATFDRAATINRFKRSVEAILQRGAADPIMRRRYGHVSRLVGDASLGDVLAMLDGWHAATIAADRGDRRSRVQLLTIAEMRLALRWIRRHAPRSFPRIIAVLTQPTETDHEI